MTDAKEKITYRDAGVDTKEGERAVSLMNEHVKKTFGPEVLTGLGSFGSLFKLNLTGIKEPVLVAGSDGVGTKLKIAIMMDKHDTIGIDLVAMCVNDVLCQGAKPLFFLDYIATGKVAAERVAELVKGVADGCVLGGCALVGGETAEMPGIYAKGDYDMAGFSVGIVAEGEIVDGSSVSEGDVLIGLPSSGFHSNGYSLVRKIFFDIHGMNVDDKLPDLGGNTLGSALIEPTRIYAKEVASVLNNVRPHAMIHITGGGFYENIPRVIPDGLGVCIDAGSWDVPDIFGVIARLGNLDNEDLFATFNMGIGFIFVVRKSHADLVFEALETAGETNARIIGSVVRGAGVEIV
jgi:phosphoribosylformylglycinamidine cyclo-ligase